MEKRNFCTLFDSNYLLKGIAMLQSLEKHCESTVCYVLCMDRKTEEVLESINLSFVVCVPLANIEDDELLHAKSTRGAAEYCWTLSSCFTWYVFQENKSIDFITYLDADLLFYSSLDPVFTEIGNASIAIIEHRFTKRLQHLVVNGRFCVEWVSFRRDNEGIACLSRWREQCIDWCYHKLEGNRMGDQKYLDEWPSLYPNCHIIQHIGAGVAPWNYAQYIFSSDEKKNILVEGQKLVFYHFHQFQLLANGEFDRLSKSYTDECDEPVLIYETYELALKDVFNKVKKIDPGFSAGLKPAAINKIHRMAKRFFPANIKKLLRKVIRAKIVRMIGWKL